MYIYRVNIAYYLKRHSDKRQITTAMSAPFTGEVLLIQLVYEGKPKDATLLMTFLVTR